MMKTRIRKQHKKEEQDKKKKRQEYDDDKKNCYVLIDFLLVYCTPKEIKNRKLKQHLVLDFAISI